MRKENHASGALRVVGHILLIVLVTVLLVAVFLMSVMVVLTHGPSSEARRLFVHSVNETSALKFIPHIYLSNEKVEAIERQKELINQSIREVQTLFDSRMDYWFSD